VEVHQRFKIFDMSSDNNSVIQWNRVDTSRPTEEALYVLVLLINLVMS